MTSISLETLRHLLNAAEEVAESFMSACEQTPDSLDNAITEARIALHLAETRLAVPSEVELETS